MKPTILGVTIVLVVLVGLKVGLSVGGSDDKQQIRTALKEAIEAGKDGKAGGVIDLLSKHIKVNSQEAPGGMSDIADFVKKQKPDVEVENQEPIVTGEEARITSPVTLTVNFLGQTRRIRYQTVTLTFSKEGGMKWLVFPSKVWKLSEVQLPADQLPDIVN